MTGGVLIAGIGNVFLADDGFGVAVAQRLAAEPVPPRVRVGDFGIRGMHLAYELLDGYDTLILIDAVARGGPPGTLYVIEPDAGVLRCGSVADAHGMDPQSVLDMVATLGGRIGRVLVVGCEAHELVERIGLSETVARAVPEAVRLVRRVLEESCSALGQPTEV